MTITRNDFKNKVYDVLINIGIEVGKIHSFLKSEITIEELGLCTATSTVFDYKLRIIYPNYDACLYNDTFDKLWIWNEHLINNTKTIDDVREMLNPYINLH